MYYATLGNGPGAAQHLSDLLWYHPHMFATALAAAKALGGQSCDKHANI